VSPAEPVAAATPGGELRVSEPLRVAVVGAGDMGGRHVRAWSALGHQVVSITDMDAERARQLAEEAGVPKVLHHLAEAVSDPEPEVVSICLPLALHARATIIAADQGKHVIIEKPLCRTFAEADAMEAAIDRAGVLFGVGFQRNLGQEVALLRRLAAEGRFGRPMLFSSDLLQEVRAKRVMHDRGGNNGPLTDAGCHYYLMWQTVFRAKPRTVYAQGRIAALERSEAAAFDQLAIDTAVVTVDYESGDIATLTVSWGLPAGFQLRGRPDRLVGPRGGAESTRGAVTLFEGDSKEHVDIEPKDLHQVELGLFAEAVRGGRAFPSGFTQGRQMLAVTEAILRSLDSGRPEPVWYDR
jgi:predicted dehydrogenase